MPDEQPGLGQPFVIEYTNGDPSYPVVGIMMDPQSGGYSIPNVGAALTVQRQRWPDHKFVEVKPTETDRRVIHIFRQLPFTLIGKQVGEWSDMDVVTRIGEDVSLDTADTALSSDVKQVGGLWEAQAVKFPPANASGVVATSSEEVTDENTGIVIDVTRYLVESDQAAAYANTLRAVANTFVERKSGPTHRLDILIASKVRASTLPGAETFYFQQPYNFPDILSSIGMDWSLGEAQGASVSEPESWAEGDPKSYELSVAADQDVDGSPRALMAQGKNGQFKAKRVVTYSIGQPPAYGEGSVTPLVFEPSYAVLTVRTVSQGYRRNSGQNSASFSATTKTKAGTIILGPFLHSSVTLNTPTYTPAALSQSATTGSVPWGGSYPVIGVTAQGSGIATMSLPASSAPLTTGWYVIDDDLQRLFLNLYRRVITSIYFP